jgi:elongation factor P
LITATSLRNGTVIKMRDEMYVVTDFLHITPGNWRGYVQATLRSLRTGKITKQRFRSTDSVEDITLEPRKLNFLYREGENYHFMDLGDYNTLPIPAEIVGEGSKYLTDGVEVEAEFHEGNIVWLQLPNQVTLTVTETAPGVKGDSVSSNTKPATLETGLVLQVPLFVNVGDRLRVDTRTGAYLGRA